MIVTDNSDFHGPSSAPVEMTIGGLLEALAGHEESPLVFLYDGRAIRPGYHITEVKTGQFAGLDCGANPESWTEIFVQLLDGHEEDSHMRADKCAAIIRKVMDHVSLDPSAKLTFEVSDGQGPIQLQYARQREVADGNIYVHLSPRPASCKPRDRWLQHNKQTEASCSPTSRAEACCAPSSKSTACCPATP